MLTFFLSPLLNMDVMQPCFRFSGKYPYCTNKFIRWQRIVVIICFESTKTKVAIVFTLLPLSFKSLIIVLTSFGSIGAIKKICWWTLSGRYDLASQNVVGISEDNYSAILVK